MSQHAVRRRLAAGLAFIVATGGVLLLVGFGGPWGRRAPSGEPGGVSSPSYGGRSAHGHGPTDRPGPEGPAAHESSTDSSSAAAGHVLDDLAKPGQGHPTRFVADRNAELHAADRRWPLPCTLWFSDSIAVEGDTPIVFRMKRDGSGTYEFFLAAGRGELPFRFLDPEGRPLTVIDVKFSVDQVGDDRTDSTFRLNLTSP